MFISKLKDAYSAQELAEINLKSIPNTRLGITYKAKRENWAFRKRSGRGGGVEYALTSLPIQVQNEIRDRYMASLICLHFSGKLRH